jgi:hypothetical protein
MANNENGNLVDSSGNVAVDFVWGNFPLQPNDERLENGALAVLNQVAGALLTPTKGNHEIAYRNWSDYPLYTPNTAGDEDVLVSGAYVGYAIVPNVSGLTTAVASRVLVDDGFVVTTATAASNVGKSVTAVSRTAGSAIMSITCASHGFVAGNQVTLSDVSGGTGVNGVWSVQAVTNANVFTVTGTSTTVQALTGLAGVVSGVVGTIKTQSVAAGADTIAVGAAITITPFAAAS